MALVLYVLPILLQVAASRVHHHHITQDVQDLQDKLAGVDLADILVPILSKQELEYKANNQSDERVHALNKLLEKSHVAIILAKRNDENHSIDSNYASSKEEGKHKHLKLVKPREKVHKQVKHSSSQEIQNYKHLKYVNSEEVPKLKSVKHLGFSEMNNLRRSGLNSKDKDFSEDDSRDEIIYKDEKQVSQKEQEEEHKGSVEHYLKDILDLRDKSSESDEVDNVNDDLNKDGLNFKHNSNYNNLHKKITHNFEQKNLLENHVSRKQDYKVSVQDLKSILNSSDESSVSDEDKSDFNTKHQDSTEDNSYEEIKNKNEARKEGHKNSIEHFKGILNLQDKSSESDEKNSFKNNILQRSGLNAKHKESHEDYSHKKLKLEDENESSLVNHVPRKEEHENRVVHLKNVLGTKDKSLECDEEDSFKDHDSLIKHTRLGKNLHFYDKHNKKKLSGGVLNLFFHFA